MPERKTIEKAKQDKRQGKSASTQAGEFVKEQIHHVREGRHGVRSTKQAIAIGLSEARAEGKKVPRKATKKKATKKKATKKKAARKKAARKKS